MRVSRAGYYKWKNHKPSHRDLHREEALELVKEVHGKHISWKNGRMLGNFLGKTAKFIKFALEKRKSYVG